jgi:hypothetical protein
MNIHEAAPGRLLGIVLRGGASKRMGCDKGLLPWLEDTGRKDSQLDGTLPGHHRI